MKHQYYTFMVLSKSSAGNHVNAKQKANIPKINVGRSIVRANLIIQIFLTHFLVQKSHVYTTQRSFRIPVRHSATCTFLSSNIFISVDTINHHLLDSTVISSNTHYCYTLS